MKDVTLNQLEQTRLHVLNSVLEHQLPVAQAAEILRVSERHAWRRLSAYRLSAYGREGAAALAHGNRGRKPRNAVADDATSAVVNALCGSPRTHRRPAPGPPRRTGKQGKIIPGEIVPSRTAPPRPDARRGSHGPRLPRQRSAASRNAWATIASANPSCGSWPTLSPIPSSQNRWSRTITVNLRHSEPPARRELTPRQLAVWKAVQQAQAQGLSLRAVSRQLGVHRNTVRKYARSPTQPTNRPINRGASRAHQPAISRSD